MKCFLTRGTTFSVVGKEDLPKEIGEFIVLTEKMLCPMYIGKLDWLHETLH